MSDGTLKPRIEALMRWLLDEGHITPVGVRQIQSMLDDDAGAAPEDDQALILTFDERERRADAAPEDDPNPTWDDYMRSEGHDLFTAEAARAVAAVETADAEDDRA